MPRKTEAKTEPQPVAMTADDRLLIEVLAKTDLLFKPYRWDGGSRAPGSIYARRRDFAAGGVVAAGTDTDAASRKQHSRRIARLVEAGMLDRSRPRSRTRGVRLTSTGDEIARAYCGLPGLEIAFARMRRMVEVGNSDLAIRHAWPATELRPLIREIYLLDPPRDWWKDDDSFEIMITLESQLAPVAWRGYVEAHSDSHRRNHYMLTTKGLDILQDAAAGERAALLHMPADVPYCEEAMDHYWKTLTAEITGRRRWADEGTENELGYCPLSCSLPNERDLNELRARRKIETPTA